MQTRFREQRPRVFYCRLGFLDSMTVDFASSECWFVHNFQQGKRSSSGLVRAGFTSTGCFGSITALFMSLHVATHTKVFSTTLIFTSVRLLASV